ncbi:MAG: hypothetical protein PUD15_01140 [Prevotella sp.]|nr:hypothetical protein [Prevotella sp.]
MKTIYYGSYRVNCGDKLSVPKEPMQFTSKAMAIKVTKTEALNHTLVGYEGLWEVWKIVGGERIFVAAGQTRYFGRSIRVYTKEDMISAGYKID